MFSKVFHKHFHFVLKDLKFNSRKSKEFNAFLKSYEETMYSLIVKFNVSKEYQVEFTSEEL